MPVSATPPDLQEFNRWLARKADASAASTEAYQRLLSAARAARDEAISTTTAAGKLSQLVPRCRSVEVLQLLAAATAATAATADDSARPPELTTARGFRVTLAYDDGAKQDKASICVLVVSPPELIQEMQGQTAFLWNGSDRFELGEFDSEGKAIGTLPTGIEISLSDLTTGRVKFDGPPSSSAG
jgi:hypothetical protein